MVYIYIYIYTIKTTDKQYDKEEIARNRQSKRSMEKQATNKIKLTIIKSENN